MFTSICIILFLLISIIFTYKFYFKNRKYLGFTIEETDRTIVATKCNVLKTNRSNDKEERNYTVTISKKIINRKTPYRYYLNDFNVIYRNVIIGYKCIDVSVYAHYDGKYNNKLSNLAIDLYIKGVDNKVRAIYINDLTEKSVKHIMSSLKVTTVVKYLTNASDIEANVLTLDQWYRSINN